MQNTNITTGTDTNKSFYVICIQVINYDSPRGGISSVTEKGIFTTSRLLIQQAIGSDSGVYSCTPSNAPNATIRVHVVDGKFILISDTNF